MSLLGADFGGDAPDGDPGATVMWFGKHKGKRLDELDLDYRYKLVEFASETPSPNLVRFKKLHEKYVARLREHDEPGASIMWFGMHKGTRLDRLDERYRRDLVHLSYEHPSANLAAFRHLHEKYLSWLDERRSPLSTVIWFGKFKGHEVRVLYDAPRRWEWLVENCGIWRDDLVDIERRYVIWKSKRPARRSGPRAHPHIVNPVGEKLGLQDDGVASDADDPYDSDDGFIVPDDHESTDAEDTAAYDTEDLLESEGESNVMSLDDLLRNLKEEDAAADREERQSRRELSLRQPGGGPGAEDEDDDDLMSQGEDKNEITSDNLSDCSLPSLGELFNSLAAPKATPSRRRLVTRAQAKRRSQISAVDDSEDTDLEEPPAKRNIAAQPAQRRRRSKIVIRDSESDSDISLVSPSARPRQTYQKASVDGDSSDDKPLIRSHEAVGNMKGRRRG